MSLSVLHLVNHCEWGGNALLAVDLACEQAARGQNVTFASAGGRYVALLERCGVRHVMLEQTLRQPWRAVRGGASLVSLCWSIRPDVIHAHMMSSAVLGRVAGTLLGVPLVTTVHNSFDRHSGLMRLGDAIVAVSRSERELLLARGFPERRVALVVNGTLGSARSTCASEPAVGMSRPCVTTMCGLERRKGVHDVIAAFSRVAAAAPEWRLVIAGDGPERAALEQQAASAGCLDRIDFIGYVDEPSRLLSQTDVFVLASYAEPFGLVILEARAAGCAVIGTRVGGIAEQLGQDVHGRTIDPGRPDLLAEELRRLMTTPAALAAARQDASQGLAVYQIGRMADEYDAIYKTLIPGHAARESGESGRDALGTSSATRHWEVGPALESLDRIRRRL